MAIDCRGRVTPDPAPPSSPTTEAAVEEIASEVVEEPDATLANKLEKEMRNSDVFSGGTPSYSVDSGHHTATKGEKSILPATEEAVTQDDDSDSSSSDYATLENDVTLTRSEGLSTQELQEHVMRSWGRSEVGEEEKHEGEHQEKDIIRTQVRALLLW